MVQYGVVLYKMRSQMFKEESSKANCLRSVVLLDRASFVAFPVASLLLGIGYWAYYMDKRRNFEACWEEQQ